MNIAIQLFYLLSWRGEGQIFTLVYNDKKLTVLYAEHSSDLDNSEIRLEISGKFLNVVLKKDGEAHLDRTCEK